MSQASDLKDRLAKAKAIYEVVGDSGATYIFFWFSDSIVAARRKPSPNNRAAAQLELGDTMSALDDCGMSDFEGTTYRKGAELLKRLNS